MSKKGENIYKRKDGRWEGRYIRCYDASGKAKYGYLYGRAYNEVKQLLIQKKNEVLFNPNLSSNKEILYSEVLNMWLASSRFNTKESTYARYTHLIKTHIAPHLGKYQLSRISTELVEEYIECQLTQGRLDNEGGLSPKTVNDILTIVKSTMEYAKYKNMVVICNLSKLSIKKKENEMRVLSQEEQGVLTKVLLRDMDLYKFGVLLSLCTGIRIGELCALQWNDVCLANSTLRIRKTMQRIQECETNANSKTKVIITEPKSQCSIRDIPIPKFICDLAIPLQAESDAFILSGSSEHYIEPRTMQNRFKNYVIESGIADTNFHALRHTFATRCVEVGFEIKSLSEVLGHANVNITLNKYVHPSFELKCANMNKLNFCV